MLVYMQGQVATCPYHRYNSSKPLLGVVLPPWLSILFADKSGQAQRPRTGAGACPYCGRPALFTR